MSIDNIRWANNSDCVILSIDYQLNDNNLASLLDDLNSFYEVFTVYSSKIFSK
jgi:hypothetical protein